MDSVPVNGHLHTFHVVLNVDNDSIVFAHLYTGSRNHSVRCQDTPFHAIGQDALAVRPHGIRCIRGTELASAEKEQEHKKSRSIMTAKKC